VKTHHALAVLALAIAVSACRSRGSGANTDSVTYPKTGGQERHPDVPVVVVDQPGQAVFQCDDLQVVATNESPSTVRYEGIIGEFPRFDALIGGELKDKLMAGVGSQLELDQDVMGLRDPNRCTIAPWPQAPVEKQYRDHIGMPLATAQVVKSSPGEVFKGVLRISGIAQWVGGQDDVAKGPSGTAGPDFVMLSTRKPMLTKIDDAGNYSLTVFVLDASVDCGRTGATRTSGIGHYAAKDLPLTNCRVTAKSKELKSND
jgi:hypothetical protein